MLDKQNQDKTRKSGLPSRQKVYELLKARSLQLQGHKDPNYKIVGRERVIDIDFTTF